MLMLTCRVMAELSQPIICDARRAYAFLRHFLQLTHVRQICPGGEVDASIDARWTTKAGANSSTTARSLGRSFALSIPGPLCVNVHNIWLRPTAALIPPVKFRLNGDVRCAIQVVHFVFGIQSLRWRFL